MIAVIRRLTTITGLAYIGLCLAGVVNAPVLSVVLVAFCLIFSYVRMEGPPS